MSRRAAMQLWAFPDECTGTAWPYFSLHRCEHLYSGRRVKIEKLQKTGYKLFQRESSSPESIRGVGQDTSGGEGCLVGRGLPGFG